MAQKESQLTGSSAVDFGIITAHSILLPTNHTAGTIERREDGIRSELAQLDHWLFLAYFWLISGPWEIKLIN